MDDQRELRAYSDHLVQLITRLRELETEKHHVGVGSPEFVSLAREVEELSRLIFRWSGLQVQSAEHSAAQLERGEISNLTLDDYPPRRLDVILSAWREAQFRFEFAKPGSAEAIAAANDIERLREEFHSLEEKLNPKREKLEATG